MGSPYPWGPGAQIQEGDCTVITLHSWKISFFPWLSMVLCKYFAGNNGYIHCRHKRNGLVIFRQDQSLAILGRGAIQISGTNVPWWSFFWVSLIAQWSKPSLSCHGWKGRNLLGAMREPNWIQGVSVYECVSTSSVHGNTMFWQAGGKGSW